MKKSFCLSLLFFSFFASFVFATDWTVAAMKFDVVDSAVISESERKSLQTLSTQIPSLMLDYLPLGVYRTVYPEEILERDLYEIRKNKQAQYEALHNAIVSRDTLLFTYSGFELKRRIRESEKTITGIKEKIESYNKQETEIVEKFNQDQKKKNTTELVSIYKNDSSKLFEGKNGELSQKDINSSSIRSLITGKIHYNHGFLQVETQMTLYPKNIVVAFASEIGTITESEYIALSLMNVLLGTMINDKLISADILIYPKEAGDNSTIFIEDSVYHGSAVTAKFTSGKHAIRVESPGFDTVYFSMDYESQKDKTITITMNKKNDTMLLFEEKRGAKKQKPVKTKSVEIQPLAENLADSESVIEADGEISSENSEQLAEETQEENKSEFSAQELTLGPEIFLNTISYGYLPLVAEVADEAMLGESVTEQGNSAYFLLKSKDDSKKARLKKKSNPTEKQEKTSEEIDSEDENVIVQKQALVSVPVATQDLGKKIDLTRKIMYWSFGGLILTVPVYYYFSGMTELADINASVTGITAPAFSTGKTISMYVLIGAGVNFLTQLIIYLVNANKVIPTVVYTQPASEDDAKRFDRVQQIEKEREPYIQERKESEKMYAEKKAEEEKKEEQKKAKKKKFGKQEADAEELENKVEKTEETPEQEEIKTEESEEEVLRQMKQMEELIKSIQNENR